MQYVLYITDLFHYADARSFALHRILNRHPTLIKSATWFSNLCSFGGIVTSVRSSRKETLKNQLLRKHNLLDIIFDRDNLKFDYTIDVCVCCVCV